MTQYGPLAAVRKADFQLDPVTNILESVMSSIVCQEGISGMYLDMRNLLSEDRVLFPKASNFRLELLFNFLVYLSMFKST